MLKDFRAKDFIALVVILAMVVFKLSGHNGTLDTVVAIIIGYYFAKREETPLVVDKNTVKEIMIDRDSRDLIYKKDVE